MIGGMAADAHYNAMRQLTEFQRRRGVMGGLLSQEGMLGGMNAEYEMRCGSSDAISYAYAEAVKGIAEKEIEGRTSKCTPYRQLRMQTDEWLKDIKLRGEV